MEICSVNTVILVNYNCMIPILKKNDLPEENFSVVKTELIHFWLPECFKFEQFVENTAGEYRTQYYSTINPLNLI